MSDNTPDFDKMSPEEIMLWMETLAKRQGAYEGFTTDADMDIAEIDPDTVVIDEPGYIPYGQENKPQPAKPAPAAPKPAAAVPTPPPPPAPVIPITAPAPPPAVAQPAASTTPDFDSMSPEEIMSWMETLAKRQGAYEGFTTSADMDIAEIDPDTVVIDEPGYIPYGQENKPQPEKPAPAAPKPAAAAPVIPTPPPALVASPAASQPVAAGTPDLDNMSPEQLMSWMETLAKRQGAYEGFTTDADMDIAEIDPGSVVIDEPGYVPFGQEPQKPAAAAKPPVAAPMLERFEEPEEESTKLGPPVAEPVGNDAMAWLESLAADQGVDLPGINLPELSEIPSLEPAQIGDPMAWLENLANSDQFDIPGLESILPAEPAATAPQPSTVGDDPMAWLETLAKRQGADPEELTTSADLNIPGTIQSIPSLDLPSFESFLTDAEPAQPSGVAQSASFENLDDPAAWLDALAGGQNVEIPDAQPQTIAAIDPISAINRGEEVDPSAMADWMNKMMDRAEQRTDVVDFEIEEEEIDLDAPAVAAELPDWLTESLGTPPTAGAETASVFSPVVEAPNMDLPDWLQTDISAPDSVGLEDIFAATGEDAGTIPFETSTSDVPVTAVPVAGLTPIMSQFTNDPAIDRTDSLAEALEIEYQERLGGGVMMPEQIVAASKEMPTVGETDLEPESELSVGELVALPAWLDEAVSAVPAFESEDITLAALPDWLSDSAPVTQTALPTPADDMPDWLQQAAEPAVGGDLPDWLREAAVEPAVPVPGWLVDTVSEDEPSTPVVMPAAAQVLQTSPVIQAPIPAAPITPGFPAIAVDVSEVFASARGKVQSGDIDGSLRDYEVIIRAGGSTLTDVVNELRGISSAYKDNPATHRVLGDALMRSGRLQEALDTYRKALNLL